MNRITAWWRRRREHARLRRDLDTKLLAFRMSDRMPDDVRVLFADAVLEARDRLEAATGRKL